MSISAAELENAQEEVRRQTGYKPNVTPARRLVGIVLVGTLLGSAVLYAYGKATAQDAYAETATYMFFGDILIMVLFSQFLKMIDPQYRAYSKAVSENLGAAKKRERSIALVRAGMALVLLFGVAMAVYLQHISATFAHMGKSVLYVVALIPVAFAAAFVAVRKKKSQ